ACARSRSVSESTFSTDPVPGQQETRGMYETLSLYIDGQFIGAEGRKTQPVTNPADDSVLAQLPHASREDLDRALAAAQRAFGECERVPPLERGAILRKAAGLLRERADEIARNIVLDMGKPLAEAKAEVMGCAEHAEWNAEEGRRIYGRVIAPRNDQVRQFV